MSRVFFEKLVSCTWDEDTQGLIGLSWQKLSNRNDRAGTVFNELSRLDTFKTHYDPRSKGGPRIAAKYDQSLKTKKKLDSRSTHALDIYLDCRCAQNANDKLCDSTFMTGFKSLEIEQMYSTKSDTIDLHVLIKNDCRHRIGEHTRQCRGAARQDLIKKNTSLKSGRQVPLDADALFKSNIGVGEDEEASLSSRQVAYNMTWESKQQILHDKGLVK